jgi:hypothetical protein
MPQQDSPAVKQVKVMLEGKRLAHAKHVKRMEEHRMLREEFSASCGLETGIVAHCILTGNIHYYCMLDVKVNMIFCETLDLPLQPRSSYSLKKSLYAKRSGRGDQ